MRAGVLAAAFVVLGAGAAPALVLTYDLLEWGFEGGGSFGARVAVEDSNGDGSISWGLGELRQFRGQFSGNSVIADTSFGMADISNFSFDLITGQVEVLSLTAAVAPGRPYASYLAGSSPSMQVSLWDPVVGPTDTQTSSNAMATRLVPAPAAVPLPASVLLLAGGLAATGLAVSGPAVRRRARAA